MNNVDYIKSNLHFGLIKTSSLLAMDQNNPCPIVLLGLGVGCNTPVKGESHLYRIPDGKGLKTILANSEIRANFKLEGKHAGTLMIKSPDIPDGKETIIREGSYSCLIHGFIHGVKEFDPRDLFEADAQINPDGYFLVQPWFDSVKTILSEKPPMVFSHTNHPNTKRTLNIFPGKLNHVDVLLDRCVGREEICQTFMGRHFRTIDQHQLL